MIAIGRQMTMSFRSPISVFRQIADILLAQIDTGALPADEPIPSQAELAARFKVARGTCAAVGPRVPMPALLTSTSICPFAASVARWARSLTESALWRSPARKPASPPLAEMGRQPRPALYRVRRRARGHPAWPEQARWLCRS
jgi:hypothetical protein